MERGIKVLRHSEVWQWPQAHKRAVRQRWPVFIINSPWSSAALHAEFIFKSGCMAVFLSRSDLTQLSLSFPVLLFILFPLSLLILTSQLNLCTLRPGVAELFILMFLYFTFVCNTSQSASIYYNYRNNNSQKTFDCMCTSSNMRVQFQYSVLGFELKGAFAWIRSLEPFDWYCTLICFTFYWNLNMTFAAN